MSMIQSCLFSPHIMCLQRVNVLTSFYRIMKYLYYHIDINVTYDTNIGNKTKQNLNEKN